MDVVVTGVAGFIGFHVAKALMKRGDRVIGIDDVNDHYAQALKYARLGELHSHDQFRFREVDICDFDLLQEAVASPAVEAVVHLAARPGVRDSVRTPLATVRTNVLGHTNVLEACRTMQNLKHLVYASSSSVYSGNDKTPFDEQDRVDRPMSVYAASKQSGELLSHSFATLYGLRCTGLRFFTVYGPWGRPDMAVWSFTKAAIEGRSIRVFNNGRMRRDFTHIDDIVTGLLLALDSPPQSGIHRVYNIGGGNSEELLRLIQLIEQATDRKIELDMQPRQPGEALETLADTSAIRDDLGYAPTKRLEDGIPEFVDWYRTRWLGSPEAG